MTIAGTDLAVGEHWSMRPSVPNLHQGYPVPIARTILYVILGLWLAAVAAVIVSENFTRPGCSHSVYENRPLCRTTD